jgi:hypothetical protein
MRKPQPLKDEELFALATELKLVVFQDCEEEIKKPQPANGTKSPDRTLPKPYSQLT